jgi:hypothetical protein
MKNKIFKTSLITVGLITVISLTGCVDSSTPEVTSTPGNNFITPAPPIPSATLPGNPVTPEETTTPTEDAIPAFDTNDGEACDYLLTEIGALGDQTQTLEPNNENIIKLFTQSEEIFSNSLTKAKTDWFKTEITNVDNLIKDFVSYVSANKDNENIRQEKDYLDKATAVSAASESVDAYCAKGGAQ